MKDFAVKKRLQIGVLALLAVNVALFAFFFQERALGQKAGRQAERSYPELASLEASAPQSFAELSGYFSELAREKGGAYAFEVLKRASIPPGIDLHLLGHVVGDLLYAQEGVEGMKACTHDLRNACSHSIVIGLFLEQGQAALPKIAEACYQAPGGSGAYTMCFHGLGHGVLAYAGYNLQEAIELCEKTGTAEYGWQEAAQCISGTVMEILSGVHDPEVWARQYPKYIKEEEPLEPCTAQFMPEYGRQLCYTYLTPHLFEAAGMNLASPNPDGYKKAFSLCSAIPQTETRNRDACYGGFGKEFVVLARDRDIRGVEHMTEEQMWRVHEWCTFADNEEGVLSCIKHATNSLYWGGENDRRAAIRFCSIIPAEAQRQEACFANLMGAVQQYIRDQGYKKEFCEELPEAYQETCRSHLL